MTFRTQRLARLLGDRVLAEALVAAGLSTPAELKRATDSQLEAVKGVGPATRKRIRERFPPTE